MNTVKKNDYHKTKIACYMGFITQAIAVNFAPLLFLKNKEATMSLLHSFYCWEAVGTILISSLFFR